MVILKRRLGADDHHGLIPATTMPSYLGIVLLLITLTGTGSDPIVPVDEGDAIESGLPRLEKIIQIYRFTESMEEKYLSLIKLDPYAEAAHKFNVISEKTKTVIQHYILTSLLLKKESTREAGRRSFDSLYHLFEPLRDELHETMDLANMVHISGRSDTTEEAIKLQDGLRADLLNITEELKKGLRERVQYLEMVKLLPRSVNVNELEKRLALFPQVNIDALNGLAKLLKQARKVGIEIADLLLDNGLDKHDETLKNLKAGLNPLIERNIPAYIATHANALSRVLPLTMIRLEEFERRIKNLNLDASLWDMRHKVLGEIADSLTTEFEELRRVSQVAQVEYKKYFDLEVLQNSVPPRPGVPTTILTGAVDEVPVTVIDGDVGKGQVPLNMRDGDGEYGQDLDPDHNHDHDEL